MSLLLEAKGLSKTYEVRESRLNALSDVSLEVDRHEKVGIVGTSGCGKSTLAKVLSGLIPADAGMLRFNGIDIDLDKPRWKRPKIQQQQLLRLQMVFQQPRSTFVESMKIGEAILEGIRYTEAFDKKTSQSKIEEVLNAVELPSSYASKYPSELSGGECQRAAIARAIISHPSLLICDECTSALDVTIQARIMDLLGKLCDDFSMSCLFISHDLALVGNFSERIYVMDSGRIIEKGTAEDVFNAPVTDQTKALLAAASHL